MSLTKRFIRAASGRSLCLAALSVSLNFGCATASYDDGGKPGAGDASIGGRADAGQSIRSDADPAGNPPDASQVSVDANPQCVTGPVNLLGNANFDLGPTIWVEASGGTPTPYALIVSDADIGGVSADSGTFLTWLGGYSASGARDTFYQDVAVPADATAITITGKIWIDSAETLLFGLAWDLLTLEIVNATSGAVLEEVASWSNLDLGSGWTNLSETVSGSYVGQTVRLRWTADMDSTNNTSFLLDTLSLNTTSCQ